MYIDDGAVEPVVTVKEDGYVWKVFASKAVTIPPQESRDCPLGLRISVPKGIIGVWEPICPQPEVPFAPNPSDLQQEDTGSAIIASLRCTRDGKSCHIKKGQEIAEIYFKRGDYKRATVPYDTGEDLPCVSSMTLDAKKPQLTSVLTRCYNNYPTSYWKMYASRETKFEPYETKPVPIGVTFDVPANLIATWFRFPMAHGWSADKEPYDTNDFLGCSKKTLEVEVTNFTPCVLKIGKHEMVGMLDFSPASPEIQPQVNLPAQPFICSIEPGATTSRKNRYEPRQAYPMTTTTIPPFSQKPIPIGFTCNIPPEYQGKWEPMEHLKGILEPLDPNYIKDPEIIVKNHSDEPIELRSKNPMMKLVLHPKFET